jgi:hypothetical protein
LVARDTSQSSAHAMMRAPGVNRRLKILIGLTASASCVDCGK